MDDFSQVVHQYIDVVYAAARRQVRDAELAEDVTQAVFIILEQKRKSIPADRPLSAWLLKTTSYCAANARRAENNRNFHERRAGEMARMNHDAAPRDEAAWEELSPLLDEGLNKLRSADRDAVLLKFFEKKTLRQIGDALGISEEAAGKRVARAVEKLREFFHRRGATVSASALAALLLAESTQAAPTALTAAVSSGAAATTATTASAASVAKGAMLVMAAEKTKAAVISAAAILFGLGGAAVAVKTVISHVAGPLRPITVTAPASAPAPAATLTPTTQGATWAVTLPSGRVIEVLGISDSAGLRANRWWLPDGTPTAAPTARFGGPAPLPRSPQTRQVHVVVRTNASPDERTMLSLKNQTYISGNVSMTREGRFHRLVSTLPAGAARGDLSVGCSFGPWETQARYELKEDWSAAVPPGAPRVTKITTLGKSVVIRTTVPARAQQPIEEQLVLVMRDGKVVDAMNGTYQPTYREFSFIADPAEVAHVVYRSRPYEIVELRNVALKADERPNVSPVMIVARKPETAAVVSEKR